MKKMLSLMLSLFLIYVFIQFAFYSFSKGHTVNYVVKGNNDKVNVEEILTVDKEYSDGYYFNVSFGDVKIPFKDFHKYSKQKRVVTSVDTFSGDLYTCANIFVKRKTISDIKCIKDGVLYYYNAIKGQDAKLDNLIANYNYDSKIYMNDEANQEKDNIVYYFNNYNKKQNILVSDYKGVYIFGKSVTGYARYLSMYNSDHYTKDLEASVGKYYVVADYNTTHDFLKFEVINIETGQKYDLNLPEEISFNAYFQGSYDGELYIIDIENKKQYSINPKSKSTTLVGNLNRGAIIYTENGWVTKNINEVIQNREKFYDGTVSSLDGNTYGLIKLVGQANGVYYVYNFNGTKYDVYMIYKQDANHTKHYIFTCTDPSNIRYLDQYLYYIDDDRLNVFGPEIGNKLILRYNTKYYQKLSYFVY